MRQVLLDIMLRRNRGIEVTRWSKLHGVQSVQYLSQLVTLVRDIGQPVLQTYAHLRKLLNVILCVH